MVQCVKPELSKAKARTSKFEAILEIEGAFLRPLGLLGSLNLQGAGAVW